MSHTRAKAAQLLVEVIKKQRSLDFVLNDINKEKEAPFIKELCFGSLRWYHKLNKLSEFLLNKPIPNKYFDLHCLIICALYQLIYLKTPAHAAVSESVEATLVLKKPWAKALINKTLRLFIQEQSSYLEKLKQSEEGLYSHPQWLIGKIKKRYPQDYLFIFEQNNLKAPLFLRVNQQKITRDDYIKFLREHAIEAEAVANVPSAVEIKNPLPVDQIPGFQQGLCSVQDISGQLAAFILNPQPGQRILDSCAAPGSKTSHLLEAQAQLEKIVALDVSEERLIKLKNNIERLQLDVSRIEILCKDASQSIDLEKFDLILLDAPCSGTGVIRRHPDIKVLRRPEDIHQQIQIQESLLNNLWPLLKEQGQLLYSTCSILPEENEKQIHKFLTAHPDAQVLPLSLNVGISLPYGLQILPGANHADGFYYCLLKKLS